MFHAPHLQPPPYHAPAVTQAASADADTLIPTHQMHACHRLAPARPAIDHFHALSSRPMPLVACKAGTDMDIELARCKKFSVRPTFISPSPAPRCCGMPLPTGEMRDKKTYPAAPARCAPAPRHRPGATT